MSASLKWYDSVWLNQYFAAKDVIAKVAPSRMTEFIDSLRPLRTNTNFTVKDIPNLFDSGTLSRIKSIIKSIPMDTMEMHEMKRFGRFVVHDHPEFRKLQIELTGMVSDLAGEDVEPCYNFLCLYTRMGVCEPHLDAPSAKWTLDICIDQSEPWPIHFSQIVPWPEQSVALGEQWQETIKSAPDLDFQSKVLMPGNAILFSGSSQWHYRDAIPQTANKKGFCDLLFLHYIPKGTADIVEPKNWAALFGIPQLAAIPGIDDTGRA